MKKGTWFDNRHKWGSMKHNKIAVSIAMLNRSNADNGEALAVEAGGLLYRAAIICEEIKRDPLDCVEKYKNENNLGNDA